MKELTVATTKDLLTKVGNKALTELHNVNGIDWNAEVTIYYLDGKFTIQALNKALVNLGFNDFNGDILVISQNTNAYYWRKDRWFVTRVFTDNTIEVERDCLGHRVYNTLDNFFAKGDFHEYRKSDDTKSFVILQTYKNRKYPKYGRWSDNRITDYNTRYNLVEVCKYCKSVNDDTTYISRVIIKKDSVEYRYSLERWGHDSNDVNDFIDKSGYLVDHVREEYARRVKELKAERAKAAYLEMDNTREIQELRNLAESLKNLYANKLLSVHDSESIGGIVKALDRWDGITDIFRNIESVEKRTKEKAFDSVEHYNRAIASIKAKIANIVTV